MPQLAGARLGVLNVGLAQFAETVASAGGRATQLEWSPPARGDRALGMALARLTRHEKVEQANEKAFAAFLGASPVLRGVGTAGDTLAKMGERMLLHAGPPVAWRDMCGPMQGAVVGAILYERWARNAKAAQKLAASGKIEFSPCHHHGAVGPMAGIISPSMPLWIVENPADGARAYSNFNEGLGRALRFGAYGPEVLARLAWMRKSLAPALAKALDALGGIELKPLIAQALIMGDEVHNRNAAASSLLLRRLAPVLARARLPAEKLAQVLDFVAGNEHFFLNISMAQAKLSLDAGHGVAGSSLVTAMSRNGVEFGIRVSGLGDRWFTAPAGAIDGLYFAGYGPADAARDLGDSSITETAGFGGFSMAAAPAIVKFVGGTPDDATANSLRMRHITLGESNVYQLPALDFRGAPCGIDLRKVVDTGIEPVINTGIAHREAGIGQIGAGLTRAPLACFTQALAALAAEVKA
ncbi:MAG: DUF1116 domain-containing protein [Betaproteobacteria bacterium]|nr:DUF1116 domain-containing protein [Betaproteobacteria bacterium]